MLKGLPDWQILKIVKNDGMRGHNLKLRAFRYELDNLMAQCARDFEAHAEDMLWELKYEPTPERFEELTEELADIASETAPDLVRQIEELADYWLKGTPYRRNFAVDEDTIRNSLVANVGDCLATYMKDRSVDLDKAADECGEVFTSKLSAALVD